MLVTGVRVMYNKTRLMKAKRDCAMDEQIKSQDRAEEQPQQLKKSGRYGLWIRLTAAVLIIAMLLGMLTNVDFSLLRYRGTDQMAAAQYLMDTTPYLGDSRLQRLKSLLTGVDGYSIHLQAAEIAIAKTDYDRAAKFLNKCISLSQEDAQKAELYSRLGCVYMLGEDPEQACRAFDDSIACNPEEPMPYLLRAQLRYQNQDASGGARDAGTYLELGGNDSQMLSTAASLCELGGDLEGALEAMNRLVSAAADDEEKALAYAERGRVRYLLGQEEEAAADIRKAKTLHSGALTGVHYAIIGLWEYNAGDYAGGREDFLKAARLSDEGNAEYYEQAIMCGYLTQDYDFIKKTVEEAKGKGKMTANSSLIEGILLFSEERYEEAEAALSASLDTGTTVAGAHYYRGLSRLAMGAYEKAAEDFTEALQWEENVFECIFNRGVCYYAIGQNEKALADFQNVIDNSGDEALEASAGELLAALQEEA